MVAEKSPKIQILVVQNNEVLLHYFNALLHILNLVFHNCYYSKILVFRRVSRLLDTLVLAESEPGMYLFIFQNPTSSPYLRWCPHGWFQVFNWKFGCIRAYVTSWFSMFPPKITFYSIFDGSVECTSHARFRFHCNRNRTSVLLL